MSNVEERAIQATDIDAVEAKACAVAQGYWTDPYIHYFNLNPKNKAPEINRGYFARTKSIESITKEFITHNQDAQVISIGAGSDTLYFRLLDQNVLAHKYIELDLPENVSRKINQMSKKKLFHDKLGLNASTQYKVDSYISQDPYYLFASDLRSDPDELINEWHDKAGINVNSPTLLIAECVLVYIAQEVVDLFLSAISRRFPNAAILSYDPISMNDAFGKVMIQNLKMRHIELRGVLGCESKEAVLERYKRCGFVDTKVWTMSEVYHSLPSNTLKRINGLEMLDDPEMMTQLFDHYSLVLSMMSVALFSKTDIGSLLSTVC